MQTSSNTFRAAGVGVLTLGLATGIALTRGSRGSHATSEPGPATTVHAPSPLSESRRLKSEPAPTTTAHTPGVSVAKPVRSVPLHTANPVAALGARDDLLRTQMDRFKTWNEQEIAAKIAELDSELAGREWIERANRNQLAQAEREELHELLIRRDALNLVRAERLLADLDAQEIREFDAK